MPCERQINEHDTDRADALPEKIENAEGSGPALIRTPEEARQENLIRKVQSEGD